jgi:hypothetical protein
MKENKCIRLFSRMHTIKASGANRAHNYSTLKNWYKWKKCDGHLKHAREKCR